MIRRIKTIRKRLDNSNDFDYEVNQAIKDGWTLDRRYSIPCVALNDGGYLHTMLIAEMTLNEEVK